ncbi:VOC family protein [Desertibacillus haloalkaliphilus]|uniref:VOC family protein n=1 Tax=Desertibacillus haloalkaliphilus TaxID=1328930 RepID=UPI001C267D8C|nr:VOC family protein [Desertibacillus haloalkaliphilus]MBU8907625.1 VOC family protein [Desertibacillus haloalkaliphilus]
MIKKLEHTAIIVKDIEESIDYYCDMFGFKLRAKGDNGIRYLAFLYHEHQPEVEIELMQDMKEGTEYSSVGIVNHLAFTVDHIEESIDYYKKKGVVFNSETINRSVDGAKTIFFHGPNGELLQLVEPTRT